MFKNLVIKGHSIVSKAFAKFSKKTRCFDSIAVLYTILVFSPMNQPEIKLVGSSFIILGRHVFNQFATMEKKIYILN